MPEIKDRRHHYYVWTGGAQLPFYVLVPLLYGEAKFVQIQMRVVSANILQRLHRKKYQATHETLHQAWERYEEDNQPADNQPATENS